MYQQRRGTRRPPVSDPKTPKSFFQLAICLALLVFALVVNAFFPGAASDLRAFVRERISAGVDAEAALETIGMAFSGQADIVDVWNAMQPAPPAPSPAPMEPPPVSPAAVEPASFQPSEPEPLAAPPAPVFASAPELLPRPLLDELLFDLGGDLGVDDTPPIPFGTEVPSKASFARVEPPFAYVVPLDGEVTSAFGYRDDPVSGEKQVFHYGLDISGATGADILCFADGVVSAAGDSKSYGLYALVDHGDGFVTLYAHCSKLLSGEGSAVKAGDALARVGATGKATGPHLHFEVRRDGILLDPQQYLQLPLR
jgi:hypothetical protein